MLTIDTITEVNPEGNVINDEKTIKLLWITIDYQLSFEPHLNRICKKVSRKIHALARTLTHVSKKKLIRAFITLQFSYCPLGMGAP